MSHAVKIPLTVFLLQLALLVASCGAVPNDANSRLRDGAATPKGAIAIESDGPSSHILVHLTSDRNDVGLCTGEQEKCLQESTSLLELQKTGPGFWRSSAPLNLSSELILHVIGIDAGQRSILLSAKIAVKTDLSGDNSMAPPANLPKMRPIPGVPVAFDYQGTLSRDSKSAAVVRMVIQSGALTASKRVKVKGTLVNLRNSAIKIPVDQDVAVLDQGVIDFTIANLDPETVYRLEGASVFDAPDGVVNPKAGGPVRHQFHLATAGDSKLSKAKRRLVLRAISESYDWDYNNYNSSKGYAVGGGWCDRFYTWAAATEFKVSNVYSASSFFRQHGALASASRIPALASSASMAGDMIRYEGTSEGTHTFMLISYDVAAKALWTVEGNFNSRVTRLQRRVGSPWNHGHLVESQSR